MDPFLSGSEVRNQKFAIKTTKSRAKALTSKSADKDRELHNAGVIVASLRRGAHGDLEAAKIEEPPRVE